METRIHRDRSSYGLSASLGGSLEDARFRTRRSLQPAQGATSKRLGLFYPPVQGLQTMAQDILRIELKALRCDPGSCDLPSPVNALGETKIVRARCRLVIAESSSGSGRVLFCQKQDCQLLVRRVDAPGNRAVWDGLQSLKPFEVPQDDLKLRHKDGEFELADNYMCKLDIEATDDPDWPPLKALDLGLSEDAFRRSIGISSIHDNGFQLHPTRYYRETYPEEYSEFAHAFDQGYLHVETERLNERQDLSVKFKTTLAIKGRNHSITLDTAYGLGLAFTWHYTSEKRAVMNDTVLQTSYDTLNKQVSQALAAIPTPRDTPNVETLPNGVKILSDNADEDESISGSEPRSLKPPLGEAAALTTNEAEPARLPLSDPESMDIDETEIIMEIEGSDHLVENRGRSLRKRDETRPNLNLKYLSEQQQQPSRKNRSPLSTSRNPGLRFVNVKYLDSTGIELRSLRQWQCFVCNKPVSNSRILLSHLLSGHPEKPFSYEQEGNHLRVKFLGLVPSAARVNDHSKEDPKPAISLNARESSRQARGSTESSITQSTESDALASWLAEVTHDIYAKPERRQVRVPRTKDQKRLYHPDSERILRPGEMLPEAVTDLEWTKQRYRGQLQEWDDTTAAEQEYMHEWTMFLEPLRLTTSVYLTKTWLLFVREKADWLVAADRRLVEFNKQLGSYLVMDRLSTQAVREAMRMIEDAKRRWHANKKNFTLDERDDVKAASPKDARTEHFRAGKNGCAVCRDEVVGPQQLICSNAECSWRLHHKKCVVGSAKRDIKSRRWLCDDCLGA